jgi:hypothetical protein
MSIRVSDIFAALNDAKVRYIVVGGVAVNLHGFARFTKDLDLIFAFDESNLKTALSTLESLGFKPLLPVVMSEFADAGIRKTWIEDKGMVVFQLFDQADSSRRIDLFVSEPLPFEDMFDAVERLDLPKVSGIPVASVKHLIEMKRLANRPQDQTDIDRLQYLQMIRSREAK